MAGKNGISFFFDFIGISVFKYLDTCFLIVFLQVDLPRPSRIWQNGFFFEPVLLILLH